MHISVPAITRGTLARTHELKRHTCLILLDCSSQPAWALTLLFIGLPVGASANNSSRNAFPLCRKTTKWRTELPENFVTVSHSHRADFSGEGRVISGHLANRLGSRFGTKTKLLSGVIGPISTPNDYLTVEPLRNGHTGNRRRCRCGEVAVMES